MYDLDAAYARARAGLIEIGSAVDPAVAAEAAADALAPLRRRQSWSLTPIGLVQPDPKGTHDDLVERMISIVSVISVNAGSALAHEAHVTERNALQSAELEFAETTRMLDVAVPLVVAKLRAGKTVDMADMPRLAVERIVTKVKPTPYRAAPVTGVVALIDSLAKTDLEDRFMDVVTSLEASYDKDDLRVILRMFAKDTIRYAGDVLIRRSDNLPAAA